MSASRGGRALDPSTVGLAMVPIDDIHPCLLQPRVSVSVDLVRKLADSMRAGRHDPVLEVETVPDRPGQYQIVCGEQRWRAAKEAGLTRVLVRVHQPLGYLERLRKQSEENRFRADLSPLEEAELLLMTKMLRDIAAAERLLGDAGVAFTPLESRNPDTRDQVAQHLESLKALLLENGVNVVALSPWRETESDLGMSESTRKAKLAILKLEPEELEGIGGLPSNHVALVARVDDDRRAELAQHVPLLTNRQLHGVVNRLRADPELAVADALAGKVAVIRGDPLAFDAQLEHLCDLCRQITRLLSNAAPRCSDDKREQIVAVVHGLRSALDTFEDPA